MNYYVHLVPGRLRVRIPALRQCPAKAREIEEALDVCSVRQVAVNPLTGSVIVRYDTQMAAGEDLLRLLEATGHLDGRQPFGAQQRIHPAAARAASKVRRALLGWAVGKALEANGLSLLAALI